MGSPPNYIDLIVFRGSQSRKVVHVEGKHSGRGLVVAMATVGSSSGGGVVARG